MRISVRRANRKDLDFLGEMVYEASFPPNVRRPPLDQALRQPRLARYLEGWGRRGDAGVVALTCDGQRVGAAWYRLFTDAPPRGVIDPSIPELVVAVAEPHRGQGIGTALLRALIEQAREDGFQAISLGVGETNPAIRLYERLGFRNVDVGDRPATMRIDLRP